MTDYKNPLPADHPVTPERLSELSRYLFGQQVQWSKLDMLDYDNNPGRRVPWEFMVASKIAALDARTERGEA